MSLQFSGQFVVWAALTFSLCLSVDALPADVITLNGGGTVHGKVVTSGNSKTVALTTTGGTLIIFERQSVKTVKRGADPKQKTPAAKAARPQLTPQEQAWMPKVRSLVDRASGADRDRSRKARSDLLNIDDDNAIPALAHYLAASGNDESRRTFSTILGNIPGPRAAACLVRQSLFDRSPYVRDAARKAIGSERADLARPMYIEILKMRNPDLASLAAKGIGEIGDPNGESIPYLIDALVFKTMREVATTQPTKTIDADVLDAINLQNQLNAPSQPTPLAARPSTSSARSGGVVMGGNALGNSNISQFALEGPMNIPIFTGRKTLTSLPGGTFTAPVTMWDIMNLPIEYSTHMERERSLNDAVSDTLTQLTGQHLGSHPGNWRRWWANQLKNRALEKPKTGDRVLSK